MPCVSNYWPSNFWQTMNQALAWLYGRQNAFAGNWLANAIFTQGAQSQTETVEPTTGLLECGVSSLVNYLTGLTAAGAQGMPIPMSQFESICFSLPPGYQPDDLLGPDGFPINDSPWGFGWGNLFVNGYFATPAMANTMQAMLYNRGSSTVTPGPPSTAGVIAKWQPNTHYAQFAMIVDSNNNVQMALYNGASGASGGGGGVPGWLNAMSFGVLGLISGSSVSPPNWPTGAGRLGALTADGTGVWKFLTQNYATIGAVATGFVMNLINPQTSYRVDLFTFVDVWYYMGSSQLETAVPPGASYSGIYTWSIANIGNGTVLAALYPTTVAAPSGGWSGSTIPAGWVTHTNAGVCQVPSADQPGGRLANYKAQIYIKTDIEYLQEDNIPIIVQGDGFHARAGSSMMLGTPTASLTVSPTTVTQTHRQNDWVNPGNALGNSAYATTTLYGSNSGVNESSLLEFGGFNFDALPPNAQITGLMLSITKGQTAGTSAVYDDSVSLLGLATVVSNYAATNPWAGSPTVSNYGGATDPWGQPLSLGAITGPNFAVQYGCECTLMPGSGATIELNNVTLTVYCYTSAEAPGVHILYDDPVVGWTQVFDSLQAAGEYAGLPRSFDLPSSDPLFVPNPGATTVPAIQNRSFTYDCALAIIACSAAGNFTAANKCLQGLNNFLENPGYLPSLVLENAEDGSTARWTAAGTGASITNMSAANTSPEEPPYGSGNVLDFHAGSGGGVFTYAGSGFPDSTDTEISFEHMEAAGANFIFGLAVQTASAAVRNVLVGSGFFSTADAVLYGSSSSVNQSSLIQFTGFDFTAIPPGDSILGVTLNLTKYQEGGTSAVYDNSVILIGVTGTPTDHSNASPWGAGGAQTYGGASDLWGVSPTLAQVQNASFGVQFGCDCTLLPGSGADVQLQLVSITVHSTSGSYTAVPAAVAQSHRQNDWIVNYQEAFGLPIYIPAAKTILLGIGPGAQVWRSTLVNLAALIPSVVSDTLTEITGFKLSLTAGNTDLYFDNLSVGTPQPVGSLSFSYDTYQGVVDQAYIRAGAMAWVVYAYAVYMQTSRDYSSWAALQGMINFLLTLQSAAADLTNGLFYEGYGQYANPGYQYLPGLIRTVATEHQVDLWFAFQRAAGVLSNAAVNLLKTAQITQAQATSINSTVATIQTAAATIWTNLLANLYIAPSNPLWTPTGTTAWYKADAIVGLSDGAAISTLADQSGNGHTLSAGGSVVYKAAILNGLPVMRFNTGKLASAAFSLSQPCTVFLVGMNTKNVLCWMADGLTESSRVVGSSNDATFGIFAGAWVTIAVANMANYAVVDGVFNGGSSLAAYNGSTAAGSAGAANPSGFQIGNNMDAPMAGDIAEVVVFSGALSTAQRQEVEGYLAWKWGLQAKLPSGHPYYSAAPQAGSPVAGHFAQGVTGSTLDTSQALDASGHWAALLAHANARDDVALQCAEFAYQNFLLTGQTVALSNAANSYNEAFSESIPFAGMKPYNDSAGGYSGSPASVWQEGTWGMILMLLDLYSISGLGSFFTGLGTTIDAVLTQLIQGQATILPATGDGSLLAYSLAARNLPYEFEVWPALAPTAWMWLVATNPSLLLTVAGTPQLLAYMYIPQGAEQSVDDKNGSTSVGQMEIHCIDPGGLLHTLAAQQDLIGQIATFSQGFPGVALGDFVPLHIVQISEIAFDADGRVIIKAGDVKRFIQGSMLWPQGGPLEFLPGQKNTWQPSGAQWMPNSYPASSDNPRWVSGNPLDIFLAAMQNELGVGQDEALLGEIAQGSTGELLAIANPFWAKYVPGFIGTEPIPAGGNQATLINPNPYLDVAGITALRDGVFSGVWFEFKITSPQQARSWLEDQILKPLGLVMVVTSSGQLTLKPMMIPANQTPVFGFTNAAIIGIPEVSLAPVINALAFRGDVDDSTTNTSARTYNTTVPMLQQASYNLFRYLYNHQVEATGIKTGRGLFLRAFLLGDQLFRRYAFATPVYQIVTQLAALQPELKDWVSLTHPLVPDYIGGGRGVVNIPCEIIGRSPDYANGRVRFTLLDMRRVLATYD